MISLATDGSRAVNSRTEDVIVAIMEVSVDSECHHDQSVNPSCIRKGVPRHSDEEYVEEQEIGRETRGGTCDPRPGQGRGSRGGGG